MIGASSPFSIASSWGGEATRWGRVPVRTGGALAGGLGEGSEVLARELSFDDLEGGGGGAFFFQSGL